MPMEMQSASSCTLGSFSSILYFCVGALTPKLQITDQSRNMVISLLSFQDEGGSQVNGSGYNNRAKEIFEVIYFHELWYQGSDC